MLEPALQKTGGTGGQSRSFEGGGYGGSKGFGGGGKGVGGGDKASAAETRATAAEARGASAAIAA